MPILALVRHGQSQWNLENRFTGWVDVPLTDVGRSEAKRAGELLREAGSHFDIAFVSELQRAQDTLDLILVELGQTGLEIIRDKALNERHYGTLQGLNKAETAKKFGKEQVHIWRRSYDIPPPEGESLKDTAARTLPYFDATVMKEIRAGRDVIVAAHGNSLRSIVMQLDQLTRDQVLELNIHTGVPLLYEFDDAGNVLSRKLLKP